MKRLKFKDLFFFGMFAAFSLAACAAVWGDDAPAVSEAEVPAAPKSELDNLKAEWEAVREQQIQMIREKEEQLEKLKEEIFAKMKEMNALATNSEAAGAISPAGENNVGAIANHSELEAAKGSLQAERQKFFREMARQKESLRQLQLSLDEKTRQLEAERESFEQEKKAAVS